ncbi:MAG: gliding motility-associated C-terminal domain-containing protein [Saprospiraceae bacterium]
MNLLNSLSLFLFLSISSCFLATANASTPDHVASSRSIAPQAIVSGGFSLTAESASVAPGQEFCIDITATGFDSLVAMQFTMAWDTAVIQFSNYNVVDMPDAFNFGANALPAGVMAVSWNADQNIDPPNGIFPWESVPNGTVLFELCFLVVGEIDEFSTISFENQPLNIEIVSANSNGANIGICDPVEGMATVIEPIAVTSEEITNVNCGNAEEGAIEVDFTGGTPPYNYQWEGPNGFMAATEDLLNIESGIYYLTLTDNSFVQLTYLDTFEVVGNFDISIADAGADTSLNCFNNSLIELNGTVDPDNSDITYYWYTNDGNIISGEFTLNPDINAAGIYYLVTENLFSFCSDTSEVFVADNSNDPIAEAGANNELNCFQSMINLNGTNSSQGVAYVYSWTTSGGNILMGDSTLTPLIDMPGVYTLTVNDTLTGCSASDVVTIIQDSALPMAVAGPNDPTLTCQITQIELDGTGSSTGNDFSYLWYTDTGGPIQNSTTLNPIVGDPGTYFLVVTDNANMCSDTSMVTVSESLLPPTPTNAGEDLTLTCDIFVAALDGTSSIQGPNYTYLWTTLDGNIVEGEETLTPEIDGCGTYTLEVTNQDDGCTNQDEVTVFCDTIAPVAAINVNGLLDCNNTEVTVDGSSSSSGPDYTYTWNSIMGNIVNGQGTNLISVDGSAVYGLLVEDVTNGCFDLATVFVEIDTIAPIAEAGDPMAIECNEPLSLDGTGSDEGDEFSYLWTTSNGNILTDGNETTLMPTVDVGGAYIIIVTNNETGCVGMDTVLIDGGFALESAALSADSVVCGTELLVTGNLPLNSTGNWTSSNSNDFFENPMLDTTFVMDLEPGTHVFTWTLSTVDCPAYDSESIEVTVGDAPNAEDDEFDLSGYETSHVINVLENDDTTTVQNWIMDLVTASSAGELSNLNNGSWEFTFPAGYFGTTSFEYTLCNENCPDLCDNATVVLNISEPLDTITTIPNGITPNGDGVNDEFIIPELKLNPELYPNNEFIVFNRWGDIVYKAKPYNNDWTGTDTGGSKELPAGTYYYVLRLDIGEGDGYKGDVTILR